MARLSDILKNIFWVLLLLQFAPPIVRSIKKQYSNLIDSKTQVGIIPVRGVIYEGDKTIKNMKKFFEDPEIKAIVFNIESPGGAAGTSQAIFNELKELKKQHNKYVIAYVQNMAASGGYYIACACDYIIATPSAFIGSIGAYIAHPDFKKFIEYHNIGYEVFKTGEFKAAGSPFLELSKSQRDMLQNLSDNSYEQFTKDVAEQRPQLPADKKLWAEGRIFSGQQAQQLKLIDALGSPSTIDSVLKEKAHIEGKIEWVKPPKHEGFLGMFMGSDNESDSDLSIKSLVESTCEVLEERYALKAQY